MAAPHEKLAASLEVLQELQAGDRRVFRTGEFSRVHLQRLLRAGFLQRAINGWVISSSPAAAPHDSTPWFASFWEFCARYCQARFGDDWHLSPEQSLLLQAGHTAIPRQLIIYSPRGKNNTLTLPFDTSLYDLKQSRTLPAEDRAELDGLRLHSVPAALAKVPASFYRRFPAETQTALTQMRHPDLLLRRLLNGGHSTAAGRLAGAFRRLGDDAFADQIKTAMAAAGYAIQETDPFNAAQRFARFAPSTTPIEARLRALWGSCRDAALEAMPPAPGLPTRPEDYLQAVDDAYPEDAYHSLSIEGYRVTPELVAQVQADRWRPDRNEADRASRDALAARGYWQAFRLVRKNVAAILSGAAPGDLARHAHQDWYRELFGPSAEAQVLQPRDLAGYRNDAVYLRGSQHVPPRWEAVRDAMPVLFDLLEREPEAAVRAVLGHWLFGYVHPYPDGNGRMARFLMNAMLASGGYPWTVIRVDDRAAYMAALEAASVRSDLEPFARFIGTQVRKAMKPKPET